MSNNLEKVPKIKAYLHDLFKIKDLGELKYFLGFEIAYSKRGMLNLLKDCGFVDYKPATTLMTNDYRLIKDGTPFLDSSSYR